MGAFFGLLIVTLLVATLILGLGTGAGYLLRWIIPSVEIGTGILTGVISIATSIYFVGKLTNALPSDNIVYISNGEDDDDDDIDNVPRAPVYPFRRNQSTRRKKQRR